MLCFEKSVFKGSSGFGGAKNAGSLGHLHQDKGSDTVRTELGAGCWRGCISLRAGPPATLQEGGGRVTIPDKGFSTSNTCKTGLTHARLRALQGDQAGAGPPAGLWVGCLSLPHAPHPPPGHPPRSDHGVAFIIGQNHSFSPKLLVLLTTFNATPGSHRTAVFGCIFRHQEADRKLRSQATGLPAVLGASFLQLKPSAQGQRTPVGILGIITIT